MTPDDLRRLLLRRRPVPVRGDSLPIQGRLRPSTVALAAPDDFVAGGAFGPPPDLASWSVYCPDIDQGAWLVVDVPNRELLEEAVFVYAEQHARARRLALVPWGELAAETETETVLPLYSIGRCGSTLLAKMLAACDCAVANEYDAYSRIGTLAARLPGDGPVRRRLAALASEHTWHLQASRPDRHRRLVLKMRAQATSAAPIMADCTGPRAVFLLRDLRGWHASIRAHFPAMTDDMMVRSLARALRAVHRLREMGQGVVILHYEDLAIDPLGAAAAALGRALRPEERDRLPGIMALDSQAGTALARDTTRRPVDPSGDGFDRFLSLWRTALPPKVLDHLDLNETLQRTA